MVGYNEAGKINELNKIFSDSYKSPISVIVIDSIERILGESLGSRLQEDKLIVVHG